MVDHTDKNAESIPDGPTGKAAEYIQSLISEGFKREFDQEENVVRSLPFFATSIGVLIAFLGFVRSGLPPLTWDLWSWFVNLTLICVLASLAALLVFLFLAVRQRKFEYPMTEQALLEHARDLTSYYWKVNSAASIEVSTDATIESIRSETSQAENITGALSSQSGSQHAGSLDEYDPVEAVEKAVIDDVRSTMMAQFAEAARVSRANNVARLRARARALTCLLLALFFALVLFIAILVRAALPGDGDGQNIDARSETSDNICAGQEDREGFGEACSSPHAGGSEGRLDLQGRATESKAGEGVMGGKSNQSGSPAGSPSPSGSSAAPSSAPVKPVAPPMTPVVKGQTGGSSTR